MKLLAILSAKKLIILSVVAVLSLATVGGVMLSHSNEEPQTAQSSVILSKKECTLKANNEYADKIKLFGTPVVIGGKEYDSLSKEQWESLNNDRLEQIDRC